MPSDKDNTARSHRRSARANKGVPPLRYRDVETAAVVTAGLGKVAKSKSSKSCNIRRQEVELEAKKESSSLLAIVTAKEAELRIAEKKVNSIQKRLDHAMQNTTDAEHRHKATQLFNDQMDVMDQVEALTVELEVLQAQTPDQLELIEMKKTLELKKVDSDEESIALDSEEEETKNERVTSWVQDQKQQKSILGESHSKRTGCSETELMKKTRPTVYLENSESEVSYSSSSTAPRESKEITMRELVDALQTFGSNQTRVVTASVDKDLPRFGGDPAQWVQFKSEYDRTSRKYNFDSSENMIRIRKALFGPAKQTVDHLMANVNNVTTVMESLEKRFGRPRLVLNSLATKAKSCGNVSTAKPESIIEFGLAVQALVANIVSFKENGYLNSVELLDALVKKLSPDLATKWFEWLMADRCRVENLLGFSDWTSGQLDIAYQRCDFKHEDHAEDHPDRRRRRGSGAINATTSDDDLCPCCQKGKHTLVKCFAFKKKTLNEKWKIVKSSKACISCLKPGHKVKECPSASECEVSGCDKQHHRSLHGEKFVKETKTDSQQLRQNEVNDANECNVDIQGNIAFITGCDGPLPIVPVKLKGPNGIVKCHALLDTGASRSLMKKSLAEELGLSGESVVYTYAGAAGGKVTELDAKKVDCDISGLLRGSKYGSLRSVMTVKDISMKPYSIDMDSVKKKWPHLEKVAAKNLDRVVPSLIVGNNNPHLILAQKIIAGVGIGPVGWRCALGWTVSGNFEGDVSVGNVNAVYSEISNQCLHDMIKRSFTLEDFGVKVTTAKGNNPDERRAMEILELTTKRVEGGWETGLLWREDEVSFPNNEASALKRLEYTEKKMTDAVYRKAYMDKMEEYRSKGYVVKLTPAEADRRTKKTCFIPHFGHTNPNKPGKFRFILDAKAKTQGVSLNDKLLTGPDLIRSLVGVLWNFRIHRVALTGDITDMFHRVKIRPEDRDSQRLLWRDGDSTKRPDHYQMVVMMFGATCSPSSAIFVKNKNASEFAEVYPRAAEVVVSDFFVDDCLTGGNTVEDVISLRQQISEINEAGNFTVCKWMSNSAEVVASIPENIRAEGTKCFENKEELSGEKVLGLWWDPMSDSFGFRLGLHKVKPEILRGQHPTKREMCGLVMSLYDPLGFVSHYKIKGLMLLQDVWRAGIGCDDEIPTETHQKWKQWLKKLVDIVNVKIPRCYLQFNDYPRDIMLNIFVDASSQAYSCVAYLRLEHASGVSVSILCGKARVAPLKKSTIPRLELQAALLGARLAGCIEAELKLKITSRRFWSDSKTVLCWLRAIAGKFKEFVANRVGEIQEITDACEWFWIPTKLNPADAATRFEGEISFSPDSEWFKGPTFLYDSPTEWNFEEKWKRQEPEDEGYLAAIISDQKKKSTRKKLDALKLVTPSPSRFSSFTRLVRAVAAVKAAARFWLDRIRNKTDAMSSPWTPAARQDGIQKFCSKLTTDDLSNAELQLFRYAQMEDFGQDLDTLSVGNRKGNGKLWRLSPVLDNEGLLRVDGSIGVANVVESVKFPIILPSRNIITEFLVDMEHVNNAHQGVDTVLCNLRKRVWIVDGLHEVKRSWSRCQLCRLQKCKPVSPKMAKLPSSRLAAGQQPFTFTGIDLFGPFTVTVGRRHEKRWGVLLCCMTTRAVHLEIVHDLSTDEVMMALSRFIDMRGRPQSIHSDNGTNFVGAVKELREYAKSIDFERIQECGKFGGINWTFNPPAAPHMGGVWERLIQSVKKCLAAVLHAKYPKDTTLLTAFKSVENMMNSRPLVNVSTDPFDPEAITPNHLLRGGNDAGPSIPGQMERSDETCRAQWKRSQVLTDQFWRRWTTYYLPKLLRRDKWQQDTIPLEVGALVYLVDDQLPRNCWSLGYISAVFPSKDGQVRIVEVTVNCKTKKQKVTYRRPAVKVYPLGLKMEIGDAAAPQFGGQNVDA